MRATLPFPFKRSSQTLECSLQNSSPVKPNVKIVIIITSLFTGGAEIMLFKVLKRLARRFTPHIISLTPGGEITARIQALGLPVESLGMRPGAPSLLAFYRLVRRLQTLQPQVVHTWMYHADLLGGLAARLARVPAIGWAIRHSNLDRDKNKRSTRVVIGACARVSHWVPDRILSCSEVARQVHVDYGYAAEKMVVVPNGFDLARFQPDAPARAAVRRELGIADNTPLVGLFGRFDPQKNHSGFFEAAGKLQRSLPTVHFVLAGKGVDAGNRELMRLVNAADVHQVTHLLGLRSDIPRLMAALDVLASSSSGEAFPNVLGEAMACGVPCAATDVGDSAYIVGDTGRVVRSGDMVGLAEALEELLALPPAERNALGAGARERVAKYFEIGQVVKRYEAFYLELSEIGAHNIKSRRGRGPQNGTMPV
jgi:glycosyltransferase involved in cell wall biosynthesis